MNISIIGTGYLGLTTAAVMAASGHKVYCLDINPEIIAKIKRGKPHFYEPGLENLVKSAVKSGNLIPTLDYSEAVPDSDISLICVNTPSDKEGNLSIEYVKSAASELAKYIPNKHIVILKSTVPVGTAEIVIDLIKSKTDKEFKYVSNPEFLTESSAVLDTLYPDRIIVGTDSDYAYNKVYEMYEQVDKFAQKYDYKKIIDYAKTYRNKFAIEREFEARVKRVAIPSAELIKVTANSFLTTKISFANAIARIADLSGADVNEVMDGIGADLRIGRDFLYAGLGWGGGCFPKDIEGLIQFAKNKGYNFGLLKEVVNINDEQIEYIAQKIKTLFLKVNSKDLTITILGLSFKPGTSDIRVSPAIRLFKQISPEYKTIKLYDPEAIENAKQEIESSKAIFCNSIEDAVTNSDLLVLATEWQEFLNADFEKILKLMNRPNILDARNRLDAKHLKNIGFNYQAIGRN